MWALESQQEIQSNSVALRYVVPGPNWHLAAHYIYLQYSNPFIPRHQIISDELSEVCQGKFTRCIQVIGKFSKSDKNST